MLKNSLLMQAVQKRLDARRAKTEERGVYGYTLSDEGCGATQQMSVFQQLAGTSSCSVSGRSDFLKISVSKIPEGGIDLSFEKDGKWFRGFLPEAEPFDFVLRRIDVVCAVRRMKETVFIEGTVATAAEAPCCRCLEMTDLPVRASFRYTFCPPPDQPQEEWELNAEDLELAYYEEDTIDLDRLIFEQIMLQLPIKPLCRETCKGLCPHCGTNMNTDSCDCQTETFDERLVALKKFKIQPEKH
jgi:uncharacterized protein